MPDDVSRDELRALVALRDARSFTGAAALLGTTQSTVSRRVASLEAWVGLPLVQRIPGQSGALTPAGEELARRAPAVLLSWDDACSPAPPEGAPRRRQKA
jgi:DNA-binding transcriptional LysR family regulator